MICTDCGNEVKPIVAVDIDGTLGDYHGHFIEFINAYLHSDGPIGEGYDGSIRFRDWVQSVYGISVEKFREIKLAYRQGAQKRSMPVYPGAANLCRQIKSNGAELWITTTRPYLRLDNIDPDTRFWLDINRIEYDNIIYDEDKYVKLGNRVETRRVVAVLDDLPEMVDQASQVFGISVPILRRTGYNSAAFEVREVDTLREAQDQITSRIDQWYKTKGAISYE